MSASMPSSFDLLKPSNLIIGLIVSVLFILLSWYIFILKPALSESNPVDMRFTKKPFSYTPFSQEMKLKSGAEKQFTNVQIEQPNVAFENETKPEVIHNSTKHLANSGNHRISKKSTNSNSVITKKKHAIHSQDCHCLQHEDIYRKELDEELNAKQEFKTVAMVFKKSFLTPARQPSCTQVQIAMNQCPI